MPRSDWLIPWLNSVTGTFSPTLKTGIASETNATRRAEWTRKRKAVEAFGAELDGRLLDLSEMLDSNFVLGVQLKKSKREMLDLRSHLYHVRKEREGAKALIKAMISESVGVVQNASTCAVERSGLRIMSDSWIAWKPRMLEPSNPMRPTCAGCLAWKASSAARSA